MRKQSLLIAAASALLLTSCSSKLGELTADNFNVVPNPLEAEVGQVPATINGTFPEKYMKKKAVVTVTPELRYADGKVARGTSATFQGEKVKGNDQTISYKVGGNYAASLRANKLAHDLGYSCEFYLDAKEKKYIDECGAANFIGIKGNSYITPKSTSILPSITTNSLMQIARDMGMSVEQRPVPEEELNTFEEAGACGTAAVISPIGRIDDVEQGKSYVIAKDGKPGPVLTGLYNRLRAIHYGDVAYPYGWVTVVE